VVEPVAECVPLSKISTAPLPKPDVGIYSSSGMFPGKFFTEVGTYSFRCYEILVLRLYPVQYIPATGELFYYPDLTVSVETVEDGHINSLFRGLNKDNNEILKKVDNPSIANTYTQTTTKIDSTEEYDMVIITSESLKSGFEPLKNAHDADGCKTLIYTVEDIYSEYSGVDNAEKVRNFIIDAYNNWGVEYVLLGGDSNVVPSENIVYVINDTIAECGPGDLYYGCLDGTWQIPETPFPSSKDISITDNGVNGYSGGDLDGPVVDKIHHKVGDSSMLWTTTGPGFQNVYHGTCILTFNQPLNLAGIQWLNFYIEASPNLHGIAFNINPVILHAKDGSELYSCPEYTTGYDVTPGIWQLLNLYLPQFGGADDFNWEEVDSISFNVNGYFDKVWLDGIYFSDWCDNLVGEPDENPDLMAEVYVGRACVDDILEVNNFVGKTITYISTNPNDEYLKNVLMAGERLGFGGEAEWGDNFLDELIDGCSKHDYTTVGIPSDDYNIDKLYDLDWYAIPNQGWPKTEIIKRINEKNNHIICGAGHGTSISAMKLLNSDIYKLRNNKPFFVYTFACFAGMFDMPIIDCFAEYLTVKTSYGAFAAIMNARAGIAAYYTTDTPSQRYYREFWDAVFGESISQIGKANQDSKEDNLWLIDEEYMRFEYYEITLFGDPAVDLVHRYGNTKPNKPVQPSGPTSGKPGEELTFSSSTTDADDDEVYYLFDWGDGSYSDWVGPYASGEEASASHKWTNKGSYKIRAKAKDIHGVQSEWSDSLPITMPRCKISSNLLIQRLLERFPNAFPILRYLMKL
jgi:hypothetical protein